MGQPKLLVMMGLAAVCTVVGLVAASSAQAIVAPMGLGGPRTLSSEGSFDNSASDVPVENASTGLPFDSAQRPVIQINDASVGQPYVDETLVAKTNFFGGWVPTPTTMTYQWFADGKKIRKARSSSYTLVARDAGKQIMVRVVGAKESYVTTMRESEPTTTVSPGRTFAASSAPIVNGLAVVGQMLSVEVSPWSAPGQTVLYSYQWLRSGKTIKGATGNFYVLSSKDARKRMSVRLTGSAPTYVTVIEESTRTVPVTRGG
jgi:hypothetical protein